MAPDGQRALRRGAVAGLLVLAVLWVTGFESASPQGTGAGINGPYLDMPAAPAAVQVSGLPTFGDQPRPGKAFLHHRGQDALNHEKAAADRLAASNHETAVPGPLTPTAVLGFNGIRAEESFCNCFPPDGAVAAGPNHILAAVNTAVKVWNKSGTLLVGPVSLNHMFAPNTNCLPNVSDPFAGYDGAADRFVVGALTYDNSNNTSICIAVSQTGDPTAAWYIYGFRVTPSQNFLDFPHASIGSDAIYLVGNQFQNGFFFTGARVYAYNKAQMYAGAPASALYYNVTNNAAGHLADSLYPVLGVGVAGTAYFLSADNCGGCSTISLWKWSTPFGSSSFVLRGGVRVQTYSQPPNARQLGGNRIATNDTRNLGGSWYNATVYGTHAIGCNPGFGTVACVQWYQIGNLDTGTPALVQQGVFSSNGKYRYYPNLAVDRAGNMVLGYAYFSSADYAGVRYTGRLASDPLGTLQPEGELKRGETPLNGARYGDYAGTALDPDGCTVWHFEEYAKSGSFWGTWVGSIRFPSC